MDNIDAIIQIIRDALAENASIEARSAAAAACREILHHLEPDTAAAIEPTADATRQAEHEVGNVGRGSETARPTMPEVAALAAAIRTVPVDQLLDLAIAKLRALVPDVPAKAATRGLSIPLIPVARR